MTESTKHCNHCDADLPASQFYKHKTTKDGLTHYCKAYYAEYYASNRERQKESNRRNVTKKRYGLSLEEYDALMAKGCVACGTTERRIVMDHCHASGNNREPLCDGCNIALGGVRDDPDVLRSLIAYLERHQAE